jgi:hypothetical protein
LILAKIIPYTLIAFFNTLEILVIGTLWFDIPIRGSLGLLLLLSGLFLAGSLGVGLFVSTIARTQQEAIMLVYFTMLPTIFLSGFFFPLAAMPPLLRAVSYVIPLRHYLIIIRSILLKGVGAGALTGEISFGDSRGNVDGGGAALPRGWTKEGSMHLDRIRRGTDRGVRWLVVAGLIYLTVVSARRRSPAGLGDGRGRPGQRRLGGFRASAGGPGQRGSGGRSRRGAAAPGQPAAGGAA